METADGQAHGFRTASAGDVDVLLAMQRDFYAGADYPFEAEAMRRAWLGLFSDPRHGAAWLAEDAGAGAAVAYVVVAFGFSLEHLGRDAFVDELYVVPAQRGRGLGRAALAVADAWCRQHDVTTLLLEVERDNPRARAVYERAGFVDDRRGLLKRRLR